MPRKANPTIGTVPCAICQAPAPIRKEKSGKLYYWCAPCTSKVHAQDYILERGQIGNPAQGDSTPAPAQAQEPAPAPAQEPAPAQSSQGAAIVGPVKKAPLPGSQEPAKARKPAPAPAQEPAPAPAAKPAVTGIRARFSLPTILDEG